MRIAAIDVDLVPLPAVTLRSPGATVRGSAEARTTAVLRITTEDGAVGEAYHEWSGPMLADIADRCCAARSSASAPTAASGSGTVCGSSTAPRSSRSGSSASSTSRCGTSRGVLGVPVHRLLGTYRDSIPAYASTTTFSTVEEYLDVADQCLELGFTAIKPTP